MNDFELTHLVVKKEYGEIRIFPPDEDDEDNMYSIGITNIGLKRNNSVYLSLSRDDLKKIITYCRYLLGELKIVLQDVYDQDRNPQADQS